MSFPRRPLHLTLHSTLWECAANGSHVRQMRGGREKFVFPPPSPTVPSATLSLGGGEGTPSNWVPECLAPSLTWGSLASCDRMKMVQDFSYQPLRINLLFFDLCVPPCRLRFQALLERQTMACQAHIAINSCRTGELRPPPQHEQVQFT